PEPRPAPRRTASGARGSVTGDDPLISEGLRVGALAEIDHSRVCYWFEGDHWWVYLPACGVGNLANHQVVEHSDKTISVSPSIRIRGHRDGTPTECHGHLEHGKWREC